MVNKFTYIKERIKHIADLKGITYSKIYKILEMTDGSFKSNAIHRPINSNAIVNLYTEFPDIDLHWLITGKEESAECNDKIEITETKETNSSNKNYRDLYEEVLEENRELNNELREANKKINTFKKNKPNT